MLETGLALGGGGSRGVFQIGAWQAFSELGLTFSAIAGTSIGSVNGALMAGADYDAALYLWQHLQIEQCLLFDENRPVRSDDLISLKNADILTREFLTHRHLNTQPMRGLLAGYIDERKIRESEVRYGLMTASLPEFKPMPKWIWDIPEGQLIEYIMASTRLPGLSPVKIDGHRMIDPGLLEMVPLSMLRDLGLRHLVAVDLDIRSNLRSPLIDNIQITYIHDRQSLGKIMDITPAVLERNRRLGYLDTLKAFGRLEGEYYTFKTAEYDRLLQKYGADVLLGLEQAALAYDLDRGIIFDGEKFVDAVLAKRREIQAVYAQKRESMHIDHKLRAISSGRLKVLSLLPPMRLAFLLELSAGNRFAGSLSHIPTRFFQNLELAVLALNTIDPLP